MHSVKSQNNSGTIILARNCKLTTECTFWFSLPKEIIHLRLFLFSRFPLFSDTVSSRYKAWRSLLWFYNAKCF